MPVERLTTLQMDPSQESSASQPPSQQRKMKVALLLASMAFSAAAFLTLDWLRSAMILRSKGRTSCTVGDPVRYSAFKPNCACIEHWGRDKYEFFTNSLGFRDEKLREVPLADSRTRILMLGDSFTEGKVAWRDSFVGRISTHFPQYDFLNGGVSGYSPSNYLNVARMVLAKGVDIDGVIVFIDINDVHDEAAYYRDLDATGAVAGPVWTSNLSYYARKVIARHLMLTNDLLGFFERHPVVKSSYHVTVAQPVYVFDVGPSAWTYRKVNETAPWPSGYAPLGVEGGIAKEKAKMTLLWQELKNRNIPISVVVYPYPAQVVHDTVDSRHVRIWREWCEGKCKRFISVFPAFFAAKDQCPRSQPDCWYLSLFTSGDTHYNAAGNALVANEVIKSLVEDPPSKHQQQFSPAIKPSAQKTKAQE